jgi:signal transduction histidine kinase
VRYIVVNLLENAIKYSEPGSEVVLELQSAADRVTLRVTDEGIGVPEAEVADLFSPFYRATNAVSRPGTGMGLPIVKKSAQLLGATVELRTAVGSGSEFTVVLPR